MRPLLAGFGVDDPLACHGDRVLGAGRAVAAARALGARLPDGRHVVNACESLDAFIVGALAAWIAGRTLVLPGTRLPGALAELRLRYGPCTILGDDGGEGGADASAGGVDLGVRPAIEAAQAGPRPRESAWPALAGDAVAAILFTSGSTGTPQPHAKTWGELADGAQTFLRSLAAPRRGSAIMGTVAPQHMFGFETTVLLPLQSGTPVLGARPMFAADLADALGAARRAAPQGVWLMTTPLQLRAFHRDRVAVAGLAGVVASTMPLDPALAAVVERDWRVPVHEIYGCTEGGMLAVRRPAVGTVFLPGAGIRFAIDGDGRASASGGHLRGTLPIADRLRASGPRGAFEIVGRDSDLVKIGGKRASLAGLTRALSGLPGVVDAAVFLPDGARRVAALVVAPGRAAASLRAELARSVDPAFLPRPLRLVDALPRSEGGKLPAAELERLLATAPRVLEAEHRVPADHPALAGHFPARPIVPGVLLLAAVEDLLRDAGFRVIECRSAKFLAPVLPGEALLVRATIAADDRADFVIATAGQPVASGSLRVARRVVA